MKVTKLPSGNYRCMVSVSTDENGKRIWKSFTGPNRKRVEQNAANFQADHMEVSSAPPPKTFSSDRYVTMPDHVTDLIRKQGYVTKYDPNCLSYAFSTLLKNNGIEHFRFHDLRHFCCSYLHGMNVPDIYIMQRSGHSTNSTLRQIYTHTLQDQSTEETQRIISQFNNIID